MKRAVPFFNLGRALLVCLAGAFAAAGDLEACTLWGTVVTNGAGGTVIAKNRDWKPDHTQVLRLVRKPSGYAYFGLFAEGGAEPGLKAGVNEKGLTVVSATAGSIPQSKRDRQPGKHGVAARLLAECASCDEVLARKDAVFPGARATILLISDRSKIVMVEVGLEGRYALRTVASGFVAHTNHFLEPELAAFNEKVGASSAARLARVTELMRADPAPCTAEAFAAISRDRHDGPDNSLWRTGKGTRTLASWIVETPACGAPRLRVVLANPGRPEETRTFVLDGAFWLAGPGAPG